MTIKKIQEIPKPTKLAKADMGEISLGGNFWSPSDVDKLEFTEKKYRKIIETCRFFYTHDPLSATVLNKLVEISINKLLFTRNGLTENEFRVFTAIAPQLKEFAENMALEFLISGLVVPEYKIAATTKEELKDLGIKKYDTLQLPVSMWLRDPATITINKTWASAEPSYFTEPDADILQFIRSRGSFPDGSKDLALYEELAANYPEFVTQVQEGQTKFLLENDHILRRKVLSNSPYPVPYLFPAIESLKHKRNIRRMDYSIASRVISAILLITLGDKDFPLTDSEEDQTQFDGIKQQMIWRNTNERDIERVFMLFGNHTLKLQWVFPDTAALLNENKYKDVNQDIIFALGFPRILITGETEKSNASDAQYATMSPTKTMDNMREKIITVIRAIVEEVTKANHFKSSPEVTFEKLRLAEFQTFAQSLLSLYDKGNISRESIDEYFGYDYDDEFEKLKEEFKALKASGLPEFAPTPNSRVPENTKTNPQTEQKPVEKKPTEPKPAQ